MEKEFEKLKEYIKDIRIAVLTTITQAGEPVSRPMATTKLQDDGTLWFFSCENTSKTGQINSKSKVNVFYQDRGGEKYISVSGEAKIIQDRNKIEELWNPLLKAWFPQELEDKGITLIKVEPDYAEFWEAPNKLEQIYNKTKSILTGEKTSRGEHQKIKF